MKKILLMAACLLTCASTFAQGTITWNNRITGVVDWKVADQSGILLQGTGYTAQLWVGATSGSLNPTTIQSTFRTGTAAGYFTGTGDQEVAGFAGGSTVAIQVRAWDNQGGTISSWADASIRGESSIINVTLGGAGTPPSTAADLSGYGTTGLTAFQLVPEPSTFALGALGIGALLMVRRRKV
jgi:hypothetical protein